MIWKSLSSSYFLARTAVSRGIHNTDKILCRPRATPKYRVDLCGLKIRFIFYHQMLAYSVASIPRWYAT